MTNFFGRHRACAFRLETQLPSGAASIAGNPLLFEPTARHLGRVRAKSALVFFSCLALLGHTSLRIVVDRIAPAPLNTDLNLTVLVKPAASVSSVLWLYKNPINAVRLVEATATPANAPRAKY